MKNNIKWLGLIVLVAVIGLSFAACGGSEPEKTISITGIPAEYQAARDYTLNVTYGNNKPVATEGDRSQVPGSTVTIDLYITYEGPTQWIKTSDRWTGEGTFDVALGVYIGNWKSLGTARGIDIKNAKTTIPFSKFQ